MIRSSIQVRHSLLSNVIPNSRRRRLDRMYVSNAKPVTNHGVALGSSLNGSKIAVVGPPVKSSGKRALVRVLQGTLFFVAGGFAIQYYRDEGTRRSVTFWRVALPVYSQYRWTEYWMKNATEEERDRAFTKLHEKYAPVAEKTVLDLRGFYLKTAQLFSTVDFFIPQQYLQFCKRMQNEVPTEFAPGEAEEVVRRNLNLKLLDEVFSDFQPNPIGSASIGQVHLARLKKTGEIVAVKVMGRGVEARFRADIQTLISFVSLAMPQHVAPMKEIQKQFVTEFDYRGEAQNLIEVRNNILPVFGDRVYIPKPFLEYCTKEVLVMEYLPGPTLIKGIKQSFGEYAAKQGTTLEELEERQRELMKRPDFKFRDISEEARRMKLYNTVMRMKDVINVAAVACYNWTVAPLFRLKRKEYAGSSQLLNLGEIIRLLAEVHAWEILKDGAFSCDPHPGNVLLMPDGRLGLIDLGQFNHIPLESRLYFAKTIVALANDDQAEVVRTLRAAGVHSKYNKSDVTYKLAAFWYDRNTKDVTGGKNIQEFMDAMEAEDPSGGLPEDLVMPGRVSVLMRALGNAFGLDLSVAKLWEPVARQVLEENGIKYIPRRSLASEVPSGHGK